MNNPEIGKRYIFAYPDMFKTLPSYTKHAGQAVTVIRRATKEEADDVYEDNKLVDVMYLVRADDGWEGHAWDSELEEQVG